MKKLFLFSGLVSILFLQGCSTASHKCPLDGDNTGPECRNPVEIYEAAVKGGGNHLSIFNEEEGEESASNGGSKDTIFKKSVVAVKPMHQIQLTRKIATGQSPKPVYIPEQVHAIWFPSGPDHYGLLHDSDTIYYRIPGRFIGGNLNQTGVAVQGTDMGPLQPTNFGVDATITSGEPLTPEKSSITGLPSSVAIPSAPSEQRDLAKKMFMNGANPQ